MLCKRCGLLSKIYASANFVVVLQVNKIWDDVYRKIRETLCRTPFSTPKALFFKKMSNSTLSMSFRGDTEVLLFFA